MNSAHTERIVISAVGLQRTYQTTSEPVIAVRRASFVVLLGQQIAIMGQSGSGKSTLLHIMAGIDRPTGGRITWPDLGDESTLRPGVVGVVFQSPSLLPALTVLENVALPQLLRGANDTEATRAGTEALGLLDMEALARKLPEELSGGQAQRVAIARVLAGQPRLILADEPTGQLDYETGIHVIDVLLAASDVSGAALIINTHDPLVADRFPIRWTMSDGELTTATDSVVSTKVNASC